MNVLTKLAFALLFVTASLSITGCAHGAVPKKHKAALVTEQRVLIVVNDLSSASRTIGAYYALKRHIPASYICHISCPELEEVTEDVFNDDILGPVADALAKYPQTRTVQYLVLTKGVPLRIQSNVPSADPRFTQNGDSVDGRLMTQDIARLDSPSMNPYYNSEERYSRAKYSLYLTTRLDGYTVADAKALVDRALVAKPETGTFLLDGCPSRAGNGQEPHLNTYLDTASEQLKARHRTVLLDQSEAFIGHTPGLMGYWSWGSNDPKFDITLYKTNTWHPGALAETAVSTSARTMLPTNSGQSLIADLIASGVTGVKGYVAEPYTFAMAHADILFDRYTRGWNLAESYYCASQIMHWKDVVIGDPLCAPYAKAVSQ